MIPASRMYDYASAEQWDPIITEFAQLIMLAGNAPVNKQDPVSNLSAIALLSAFSKANFPDDIRDMYNDLNATFGQANGWSA